MRQAVLALFGTALITVVTELLLIASVEAVAPAFLVAGLLALPAFATLMFAAVVLVPIGAGSFGGIASGRPDGVLVSEAGFGFAFAAVISATGFMQGQVLQSSLILAVTLATSVAIGHFVGLGIRQSILSL